MLEDPMDEEFDELLKTPGVKSCERIKGNEIWKVVIKGPEGSHYEDGVFPIQIDFTDGYPNVLPKMRFVCAMYHPNFMSSGEIPLESLQGLVGDIPSLSYLILFVLSLLSEPNLGYNINENAARTYNTDPREYARKVNYLVERSFSYC